MLADRKHSNCLTKGCSPASRAAVSGGGGDPLPAASAKRGHARSDSDEEKTEASEYLLGLSIYLFLKMYIVFVLDRLLIGPVPTKELRAKLVVPWSSKAL